MIKTLRIAGREYMAYVRTVGFWLSMATVPLMLVIVGLAPAFVLRSTPPPTVLVLDWATASRDCSAARCGPVPVGDAVVKALGAGGNVLVSPPQSLAAARPAAGADAAAVDRGLTAAGAALRPYFGENSPQLTTFEASSGEQGPATTRQLEYAVILYSAGLGAAEDVRVRLWSRNVGPNQVEGQVRRALSQWVQGERLRAMGLSPDSAERIIGYAPTVESFSVRAAAGRVAFRDRLPGIIGYIMAFTLWSVVITGAGILLNSVIEEKSSRILEVLLSSASPIQIMAGKILGVAMVTSTVMGVWAAIGLSGTLAVNPGIASDVASVLLDRGLVFYFLFYFLAGYLMFASLFATIGAFCETTREAQTLLGPMMMLLVIPLMFLLQSFTAPDSPALRILSFIPPFTPFIMSARAASDPPLVDILGSGALLVATIAGELVIAARAFRIGALSNARFDLKLFFASLTGRAQV